MFKKNPQRPPVVVDLKRLPNGYKAMPSEASTLFQIKRVTRTMYRPDLIQASNMGLESQGLAISSTIIQPPSHVTLPAFAGWFKLDAVHPIERQFFPEFFVEGTEGSFSFGRKNGQLYRYYRNTIVGMWRENVKKYLSSAHCRRNLVGDVSSIVRIHGFLENWGLINFPSKEHSKGILTRRADKLTCYVCEDANAPLFHLANLDGAILQLCDPCFQAGLYSEQIQPGEFAPVLPKEAGEPEARLMTRQQVIKLLEVLTGISGAGVRDRDRESWMAAQKEFPQFTREDLVYNFLRIPLVYEMNTNIFENNEDATTKSPLPEDHAPSVLEDFLNPLQVSIAVSYYAWQQEKRRAAEAKIRKQEKAKLEDIYRSEDEEQKSNGSAQGQKRKSVLDELFEAAQAQAKELAFEQAQKIDEVAKMMVEVTYSKLENKALFIYEYEKLIARTNESHQHMVANTLAESLKQNVRLIERQEEPEHLSEGVQNEEDVFG